MIQPAAPISIPQPPGAHGGGHHLLDRQDSFAAILARAGQSGGSAQARARAAAEQFVAITFVQPILAQMRETAQTPPPFGAGPGERQFRALLDAELAQQIVRKADYPLVDRVARDLLQRGNAAGEGP